MVHRLAAPARRIDIDLQPLALLALADELGEPLRPLPQPLPGEPYSLWQLAAPLQDDPGMAWLAARRTGETINLVGPYGTGFPLLPLTRRLLLVADASHLSIVMPLVDEALDRGGQVSLLLLDGGHAPAAVDSLRGDLPLAVEFHRLSTEGWGQEIEGALRWSDQVCTAIVTAHLPVIADAVRRIRVRFDGGFAFAYIDADIACGYGACLACVVPLANGNLTRAAIELAKDWRTDRSLRRLEALLLVADAGNTYVISGNGDVIEPEHDLIAIGSGGGFAQAAALALTGSTDLPAREVVERSLNIAADICIYTNRNLTIEEL